MKVCGGGGGGWHAEMAAPIARRVILISYLLILPIPFYTLVLHPCVAGGMIHHLGVGVLLCHSHNG